MSARTRTVRAVDYYMTLATVLPLLYVAIVLEGRMKWLPRAADQHDAEPDPTTTKLWDIQTRWDQTIVVLLVFVGLPLTEVGLLVGIERGERIAVVDDAIQVCGLAALLVLIVPPFWSQVMQFVPARRRFHVTTFAYTLLVLAFLSLVIFDFAGWFGTRA